MFDLVDSVVEAEKSDAMSMQDMPLLADLQLTMIGGGTGTPALE